MIAIIGKPGVGKTTLLNKLAQAGFKTLNTDLFFEKAYLKSGAAYQLIAQKFGREFVNAKKVRKDVLRKFILANTQNLVQLEKLIYPLLVEHLQKRRYDFVEIANLATRQADFKPFFQKIVRLTDLDENIEAKLAKRVVDKSHISLIKTIYNDPHLLNVVEIDVNEALNLKFFQKTIA